MKNNIQNYLKLKNILDIVSNGNRTDGLARTLRASLNVELLEEIQRKIKEIEEEEKIKEIN